MRESGTKCSIRMHNFIKYRIIQKMMSKFPNNAIYCNRFTQVKQREYTR